MHNAAVTCEIKLFQPLSKSFCNNFISVLGNLPEIIAKLFQKITAAHEYFPTIIFEIVSVFYFTRNRIMCD